MCLNKYSTPPPPSWLKPGRFYKTSSVDACTSVWAKHRQTNPWMFPRCLFVLLYALISYLWKNWPEHGLNASLQSPTWSELTYSINYDTRQRSIVSLLLLVMNFWNISFIDWLDFDKNIENGKKLLVLAEYFMSSALPFYICICIRWRYDTTVIKNLMSLLRWSHLFLSLFRRWFTAGKQIWLKQSLRPVARTSVCSQRTL